MNRSRLVGIVASGAVGAAIVLSQRSSAPPPAPPVAATERPRAAAPIRRSPGHNAPVPRPARLARPAPPASSPAAVPEGSGRPASGAPEDAAGSDAPLPENGTVDPNIAFTPENIQAAMATVTPQIQTCVSDWTEQLHAEGALEEGLDGRLLLAMTLGPDGVESASFVDVEGVPDEMMSCFAGVVYEATWPAPDQSTDIRYPFRITDGP